MIFPAFHCNVHTQWREVQWGLDGQFGTNLCIVSTQASRWVSSVCDCNMSKFRTGNLVVTVKKILVWGWVSLSCCPPGWIGRRYVWYFRLRKLQYFIFSPDSSRKFTVSYLWIWNCMTFLTRFCISTEKWDGKRVFEAAGSAWGPTSTFTKNAGKCIEYTQITRSS